jgi:predicted hydrocarbon binding protein
MVVRKHISIEKKYVDKVKPFLAKHDGNFSAAMRELIDIAVNPRLVLTHSDGAVLFDSPTADWLLRKTSGMIPEKEILYETADPLLFNSVSKTMEYFNTKFRELGWGMEFSLTCDNDIAPITAVLTIKGENYPLIDLSARLLSLYLATQKRLGIETAYRRTKSIKLSYKLKESPEAAIGDLNTHIGIMQDLFSEIEKRPDFWRLLAKKFRDNNYKVVTIHFNNFEDLLAKKTPLGEIGIESTAKRPIGDIPLCEFLPIMKEVYETSRIADRIDIEGDTLKVFHSYRNPRAVDTLKKIFLRLLEVNGHTYDAKSTRNLIILRHMPEIGIKISELITNLKKSGSNFDKELIGFLTFVSGLKEAPDISESIRALGYRMSKQILQEYEKEHKIRVWNLKTFQEALSALDSKIGRISEWRQVDENSVCYTVKKCNLVQIGGAFNIDICRFSRGVFKGALEYVFKSDVDVQVIKLLTHGDDRCEVCIRAHTSLP